MSKDTDIELVIEEIGARGDGVARLDDGAPVFVPYTAAGDRALVRIGRAKGDGYEGRLHRLIEPGPGRAPAPCDHFGRCGGCQVQHLDAATYRAWKSGLVAAALERRGLGDAPLAELVPARPGTRRRADFTVLRRKHDLVLGFNERASHIVVDVAMCPVLDPRLVAIVEPLRAALFDLTTPGVRFDVVANLVDGGIDLLLVGALKLGGGGRARLAALAEALDLARVARRHPDRGGTEVLAERRPPRAVFDGIAVDLPPGAFLQATADGEAALRALVDDGVGDAARIADLYCGVGTFALPLARRAAMFAADGAEDAVAALDAGARGGGLGPKIRAVPRDLERRPLQGEELARFDAVVLDPPRAGARAQSEALAASRVPAIVYVSCHPGTFARDARALVDGGYDLVGVAPVDQFLWSAHVELAGLFRRP